MADDPSSADSRSGGAAGHEAVLRDEVIATLTPVARELIVDCTVGLGGHAAAILDAAPVTVRLIGLDADERNISIARERLAAFGDRVRLIHANFSTLLETLRGLGIARVDGVLADLGLSSNQLADAARGFSFERDGPLDMRMDASRGETAADLLDRLSEAEIAALIYVQSQERLSRRIAKRICEARRGGRLNSTLLLAQLACGAARVRPGRRHGTIHPATRTFMALRMAVNREPEALRAMLAQAPDVLRPGGRIAVISFHSGEDRAVKESFRDGVRAGRYVLVTKKPITAGPAEQRRNPRSRSAKLRVAERTSVP